jgi:hypothetical protein
MTGINLYKKKSNIYKQNLIDDLQKYGNLKLAIKKLEEYKKKKLILKSGKKTKPKSQSKKKGRIILTKN